MGLNRDALRLAAIGAPMTKAAEWNLTDAVGDFLRGDQTGPDWRWGLLGGYLGAAPPALAMHAYSPLARRFLRSAGTAEERKIMRRLKEAAKGRGELTYGTKSDPALMMDGTVPGRMVPRPSSYEHSPGRYGRHRKVIPSRIHLARGQKGVGTLAHELGHSLGNQRITRAGLRTRGLSPYLAMMALGAPDEGLSMGLTGAATLAHGAGLASEAEASARGYRLVRNFGGGRMSALRAFAGIPTYLAAASIPAISFLAKKRLDGFDKGEKA